MVTPRSDTLRPAQDHLSIELIRDDLVTDVVGRHTYLFGTAPSTSSALRRLAAGGARDGTVVLTERHTAAAVPPWWRELEGGLTLHAGVLLREPAALDVADVRAAGVLAAAETIWAARTPITVVNEAELATQGRTVAEVRVEPEPRARPEPFMLLGIDVALPPGHGGLDRNAFVAHLLSSLDRWLGVLRKDPVGVREAWRDLEETRAAPAA
jgi:hypothetical protein